MKDRRSIKVHEIIDVKIGCDHTKVFKKHKIHMDYDDKCMSIICKKRTLDVRHDDPNIIKEWYLKIQNLI